MDEPRSSIDDIIELYMKDVDRSLIRENLRLTLTERFERLKAAQEFLEDLRQSVKAHER